MKLLALLLIFFSKPVFADLSETFYAKVVLPVKDKIVENNINLEKAKLIAKNIIIKKYFFKNIELPQEISDYHKKNILELLYKSYPKQLDLVNFKLENSKKKNNFIYYTFSSNLNKKKIITDFNLWEALNTLIDKNSLDLILSLELALSYTNDINILKVLKNWKKAYKGSIMYIVSDNLLTDPKSLIYIDKNFKKNDLNIDLEQIVHLFDKAPFNIEICLKFSDLLNQKNHKTLSKKILLSCKKIHLNKVSEKTSKDIADEIQSLHELGFKIRERDIIYKIFNYNGNLPIKLNDDFEILKNENLGMLLQNFEKNYSIKHLIQIRNILKSKKLNTLSELISNQIGVSKNEYFKF